MRHALPLHLHLTLIVPSCPLATWSLLYYSSEDTSTKAAGGYSANERAAIIQVNTFDVVASARVTTERWEWWKD